MPDKVPCNAGASCPTSSQPWESLLTFDLGARLNRLRRRAGLSLTMAAAEAGLSTLQLEKVEAGLLSPRIDALHRILTVLAVSFDTLFVMPDQDLQLYRCSVTRVTGGHAVSVMEPGAMLSGHYPLASELLNKQMLPTLIRFHREMNDISGGGHPGEVFLLVLRGQVVLRSEEYVPVMLEQGDSVYFDANSSYRLTGGSAMGTNCCASISEPMPIVVDLLSRHGLLAGSENA